MGVTDCDMCCWCIDSDKVWELTVVYGDMKGIGNLDMSPVGGVGEWIWETMEIVEMNVCVCVCVRIIYLSWQAGDWES